MSPKFASDNNTHSPSIMSTVPMSVRHKLLQYVEEHITSLIQDAVSIQRHTKRARLNHFAQQSGYNMSNSDFPTAGAAASSKSNSSSNKNSFNYNNGNNLNYFKTRLHAADINLALQLKGCEKLYGNHAMTSTNSTHQREKIMLADLLKDEIPIPPEEVSMQQHWLVIDGVMPMSSPHDDSITGGYNNNNNNTSSSSYGLSNTYESSDVLLRIHQLQSGLVSEELKLYFLRVIHTLEGYNNSNTTTNSSSSSTMYDRFEQDQIIVQLQTDDGLQELVPFFIRYGQHAIYEHIQHNHLDSCILIVRFIRALLYNPTIHLELHLHEILPSLMTCVVAKSFGGGGTSSNNMNHYILRNEAAITLAVCTNLFSKDYTTLKSRILRTLCQALEMNTADHDNLSSRYGGIIAITLFGNRAIDAFILPLIMDCWELWEAEIGKATTTLEMEIIMCQFAVLNSMSTYLQSTSMDERAERLVEFDLTEILGGDRMMILASDYAIEYNMCFV